MKKDDYINRKGFKYLAKNMLDDINANASALSTKVPLVHNAGSVYILRDVVNGYREEQVINTHMVKITIPKTLANARFVLDLIGTNASNYQGFTLEIKGATSIIEDKWYSHTLEVTLTSKTKVIDHALFGYDGDSFCILLKGIISNHAVSLIRAINALSFGKAKDYDISFVPLSEEETISNLIETPVNWVVTDDGVWYDLVLLNGATVYSVFTPQCRKIGNVVFIRGGIIPNTTERVTIATLPSGFRPTQRILTSARQNSHTNNQNKMLVINTNGTIEMGTDGAASQTIDYFISTSFIADQ